MHLLAQWCPKCRVYLGLLDGDVSDIDDPLQMPHAPWCPRQQAQDLARFVESLEPEAVWG